MAYVVLARKWRPKRFGDVVGQEHIATTLLNSIRAGRTAHAYLFVGPRGIGKTSTARIFSKALNCPEAVDGEPCGECQVCLEISDGRSIDVIEIDGASNNSVDDIRALRENVKIAPAHLKYKVYIIDEVHMLSSAAFNAFLKTLEEPPEHVKFLMATTEAQKIPMTVLSRCQRFDFSRLTSRQIHKRLKDIVDAEDIKIEEGALFAIARAADGSMRDSQSILDQQISFSDDIIKLDDVNAMLGTVGQDVHSRLAVNICEGDSYKILKTIDEIVERGKDLAQFLKELTLYFRNLLVAGFGGGEELIDLPEEELVTLKEISGRFKHSDLIQIVRDLTELESRFKMLPSSRVALEMTLMRIASVGVDITIDGLLSKLTALERKLRGDGSNPAPPAGATLRTSNRVSESRSPEYSTEDHAPVPDAPPSSEMADAGEEPEPREPIPDEEGEPQLNLWRRLLEAVQEQSMSIYSFLERGRFCGVENGCAIICFEPENSYNKTHLEETDIKKLLEETLKSVACAPMKLKIILEEQSADPAQSKAPAPKREDKQAKLEETRQARIDKAMTNPIVKKAMELFDGKIVYVSG